MASKSTAKARQITKVTSWFDDELEERCVSGLGHSARVKGKISVMWMSSKLLSGEGSSKASFPSESGRRLLQKGNAKSFAIALLLVVSFLTSVATMLVHYPQKVDAFLNLDAPVESKHVVTNRK